MSEALLKIDDLHVSFATYAGKVQAVRGVDLSLEKGEIVAVVGESGCGKSVTAQTIIRLNPSPPCSIDGGSILFQGTDLTSLPIKEIRKLRGSKIGMIFQDPMTSLDPTKQVGTQIIEAIRRHEKVSKKEAFARSVEMLELVGISNPVERMKQYPHEFSGGMRQRAMIAMALVCHPDRRRAHHRFGRDHTGTNCGPAALPAGKAGHLHSHHHPRYGRCGRYRRQGHNHVCRHGGGVRYSGGNFLQPSPSLYLGPPEIHSEARRQWEGEAHPYRWNAARSSGPSCGMPLCGSLRLCNGRLPGTNAGDHTAFRHPSNALLAPASAGA